MTSVILIGQKSDNRIYAALKRAARKKLSLVTIGDGRITSDSESADLMVWQSKSISEIDARSSVLVFKSEARVSGTLLCARDTVAVVDSQNEDAVQYIAENKINAVTCGLSSYDTITLSSLTPDSAVVSLQRPVTSFSGALIEPFEAPVRLSRNAERYSILSVCAILLLSGHEDMMDSLTI